MQYGIIPFKRFAVTGTTREAISDLVSALGFNFDGYSIIEPAHTKIHPQASALDVAYYIRDLGNVPQILLSPYSMTLGVAERLNTLLNQLNATVLEKVMP
ncbi:hypothetical protein A3K63_01970 [Candidatus Micrarchaeota archaeon RBG_16_49_10]|nr:MAG: hypothetical protein A3K63_01970 [Candidatus Micrarchaeota archaeon RBG_16_49_10]